MRFFWIAAPISGTLSCNICILVFQISGLRFSNFVTQETTINKALRRHNKRDFGAVC